MVAPPPPVVADIKKSNELYTCISKIIHIDIYNSDNLFRFIYRYEKSELLISLNQIWFKNNRFAYPGKVIKIVNNAKTSFG